MVEGGKIDTACHSSNVSDMVREVKEFSDTAQLLKNWANGRTDTLIIVVADHETGGCRVTANNGQGNDPTVAWDHAGGHSDHNVPIYAWGVGAERITGTLDNTDVFRLDNPNAPAATLAWPLDNGPRDVNPGPSVVTVNMVQKKFQIKLSDSEGINDSTVASGDVTVKKDGTALVLNTDYTYSYNSATDTITLAPTGVSFGNGTYTILVKTINDSATAANALAPTTLTVTIQGSSSDFAMVDLGDTQNLTQNPDGLIPYGLSPGNHDFTTETRHSAAQDFITNFGAMRYEDRSWFGGFAENTGGDELSYYQVFEAGAYTFLQINLEWEPRAATVEWAQRVIETHPNLPVIVTTHSYLSSGAAREANTSSDDPDAKAGQKLWDDFVKRNTQVFMVLCGHVATDPPVGMTSANDAGKNVYQWMVDYQGTNPVKDKFATIKFLPGDGKIKVYTTTPSGGLNANPDVTWDMTYSTRLDFSGIKPTARIATLTLKVKVDDAFVAFLNGVEVGRHNFTGATDVIQLTVLGSDTFVDETYTITLNGGLSKIKDDAGTPEELPKTVFKIVVDGTEGEIVLVNTTGKIKVPTAAIANWETRAFDDWAWTSGSAPVGYEKFSGYTITTDVSSMYDATGTAYMRFKFDLADTADIDNLYLDMKYDDGFIAYVNGEMVAVANAPVKNTDKTWSATATMTRGDDQAVVYQRFDITSLPTFDRAVLVNKDNVLAIQGLNQVKKGTDAYFSPRLVAVGDKPSYTYSFSGGLLTVNGTTAADTLALSGDNDPGSWYATINGDYLISPWVPAGDVQQIRINGSDGNDTIDLSGASSTYGFLGPGLDGDITVYGDAGHDSIVGSYENDLLYGGVGNDTIFGGWGVDTIYGGTGDDTLSGGADNDTYVFSGTGLGSDQITETAADGGTELLDFSSFGGAITTLDLGSTSAQAVNASHLTLTLSDGGAIENVQGSVYNDGITGNGLANMIWGGDGNDVIYGLSGADTIYGGTGDDELGGGDDNGSGTGNSLIYGDDGNDTFFADSGDDSLVGGAGDDDIYVAFTGGSGTKKVYEDAGGGTDRVVLKWIDQGVTFDMASTSVQNLTASISVQIVTANSIENLCGTDHADLLYGTDNADDINGGGTQGGYTYDTIYGRDGNDIIWTDSSSLSSNNGIIVYGEGGNDTICGSLGYDRLYGGAGDDSIYGYSLGDSIEGNDGDDTIWAGIGADTVYAGYGNDLVYIDDGAGGDYANGESGTDTVHYNTGDTYLNFESSTWHA